MLNSRIMIVWAVLSLCLAQAVYSQAQAVQTEEAEAAAKPKISFETTAHDFAEVGPRTKNTCEFKFTNTGQAHLKIGKINASCGCTVFSLDKKEYAPGETGTIKVTYSVGKSTGYARFPATRNYYALVSPAEKLRIIELWLLSCRRK